MGYFLPDDMKEAVRYLASAEWFAEEFSLMVKLEKIDDTSVKCTIKIRKILRNVSNNIQKINSYIHIDEWSHKEKAHVIACSIKTASEERKMICQRIANDGYTIHGETECLSVYPEGTVETLGEAAEFKSINDNLHYVLAYCAKSPKIYVEAPDDFELLVGISSAQEIQKHPHTHEYELKVFIFHGKKCQFAGILRQSNLSANKLPFGSTPFPIFSTIPR